MYQTEEEFLAHYNPNDFERLSMTTDILIFSVSSQEQGNYRKLSEKNFSVLLVKRKDFPYKNKWCLPGGFVKMDETLEKCGKRVLNQETGISNIYMEQLYTFSDVNRDPRMRVISTTYMALVDKNRLEGKLLENAYWFHVIPVESHNEIVFSLDNGVEHFSFTVKKKQLDKTNTQVQFERVKNEQIAFDHDLVIATGMDRLKNKIEYTDIVFNMMPEYFTLGELQQVYEVILGKKLLDPAFRRIIKNKVEKTDKMKTGEGHRPSYLYRYRMK